MDTTVVYGLVRGLHDVATAIWVGGLIHMSATILPSLRNVGDEAIRKRLLMSLQNRLSLLVYGSMIILVVTGILEAKHSRVFEGFFIFSNTYSSVLAVKHILVIAMISIALSRQMILRKIRKSTARRTMKGIEETGMVEKAKSRKIEKISVAMVFLNTAIGVTVLMLSGFLTAFSQ